MSVEKKTGLLTKIYKELNITGFTIQYNNKDWTVESDSTVDRKRNIVLKKDGKTALTIIVNISNKSVTINGRNVENPNKFILVSNPKKILLSNAAMCEVLNISREHIKKYRKEGMPYIQMTVAGNFKYEYDNVLAWFRKNTLTHS